VSCVYSYSAVGVHTGGRLISYDLTPSGRSRLPFALAPHVTYTATVSAATASPSNSAAFSGANADGGTWSDLYRGEAGLAAGASKRDRRASKAADESAPDEEEAEALYAARQRRRSSGQAGRVDDDREGDRDHDDEELSRVGRSSGRPQRSARAADHSLDDLEPWLLDMLVAIDDMGVNFEFVALAVLLGCYFCVLACMRANRAGGAGVDRGPVAPVNVINAANVVAAPVAAAAAAVAAAASAEVAAAAPGNREAAARVDAAAPPAPPVSAEAEADSAALGHAERAPAAAPGPGAGEADLNAAPRAAPDHSDA
jgi:hypothetical protein